MDKRCLNKIIKVCGTPSEFTFEFIDDASQKSDIRRMREYVKCTNKVEREYKKKLCSKN